MTALLLFLTIRSFLINQGFKKSWKMILFLSVQHIAVFIGVFGNIHFAVLAFVYNRNIPGGPAAFQNEFSNLPVPFAALAGFTICNWFQDALLVSSEFKRRNTLNFVSTNSFGDFLSSGIAIGNCSPSHSCCSSLQLVSNLLSKADNALLHFTTAFSLIFFVDIGPHPGLFSGSNNLKIIIIYFSLSVGLNFILTILIALRLLYFRRRSLAVFGTSHPSSKRVYSVVTMIVESAALYTATGLAQIVAIPTSLTVQVAISGLYGVMPVRILLLLP